MHKELEVMETGCRNGSIDLFLDTDKCAGCSTGEK